MTTLQSQTRELCQRAMASALGIEIHFAASSFEFGADEAHQEAKDLQRRIRAFRIKAKGFETIDALIERTPSGSSVRIIPHGLSAPVRGAVTDIATGAKLEEFSEMATTINAITYHLLRHMEEPYPPITKDQEALLFQHSPDAARDLYNAAGWAIPGKDLAK